MIKTLAAQIKEFKKASVLTPVFMILEVVFEMLIPLMMASIIDDGVEAGDMRHIYLVGIFMVGAALCGLFCGIMGGKFGARASTGFARNLRKAMFDNIQTFSFSNLVEGVNYIDYLTQVRMDRAKELLKNTDKPINAIALETGYVNEKYFRKLFKKMVGIKPSEYRKLN